MIRKSDICRIKFNEVQKQSWALYLKNASCYPADNAGGSGELNPNELNQHTVEALVAESNLVLPPLQIS